MAGNQRRLIVDIETDGLWSPYKSKSYSKIHVIVTRDLDTDDVEVYTGDKINEFQDRTMGCRFIGHNLLGFDWWVAYDLLGFSIPISDCTDTLCMSRLADSNRTGGHSLDAHGQQLGIKKPEHHDWSVLSDAMIHRCVEDTRINAKLYRMLVNDLRDKQVPWSEVELECYTHWYMTKVERTGFYFDIRKATTLRSELVDKRTKIESKLSDLFPPLPEPERDKHGPKIVTPVTRKDGSLTTRNLRDCPVEWFTEGCQFGWVNFPEVAYSRPEFVKKHLLKAGWKPKVFTKTGLPKLDDDIVLDAVAQVGEQYRPYAEWRTLDTRITRQLDKWLEFYNDDTHRQHGSILHIGTRTQRMSHKDPPITQVPSGDKPYGSECRECWTVPLGKWLLGTDASSIQLRVLAHYLDNAEWTNKLVTTDIHETHAKEASAVIGREVTRSKIKTVMYAFQFGSGLARIATEIHGTIGEAEELRDALYTIIPGLGSFIKDGKRQAKQGSIRCTISNRWFPCASDWHGDWLASLLQGGEATIMKRALKIWTGQANKKLLQFALVTENHDEWQTEVDTEDTAHTLGEIQVRSLQQAGKYYNCKCPIDGEYKVAKDWSGTH